MSAPQTITADGMEWPLQTYLDARGFVRVDPFAPPSLPETRLELVALDGTLIPDCYSSSVIWGDVLGFRVIGELEEP